MRGGGGSGGGGKMEAAVVVRKGSGGAHAQLNDGGSGVRAQQAQRKSVWNTCRVGVVGVGVRGGGGSSGRAG